MVDEQWIWFNHDLCHLLPINHPDMMVDGWWLMVESVESVDVTSKWCLVNMFWWLRNKTITITMFVIDDHHRRLRKVPNIGLIFPVFWWFFQLLLSYMYEPWQESNLRAGCCGGLISTFFLCGVIFYMYLYFQWQIITVLVSEQSFHIHKIVKAKIRCIPES